MRYAVIRLGGKQVKISEGQTFEIERQGELNLDVLAYSNGKETFFGAPLLKDVTVKAVKVEDIMGDKVRVVRFKAKSRYKKQKGHRQPLSVFKIEEILKEGEEKQEKPVKVKTEKAEKPVKSVKTEKASKVKKAPKPRKAPKK
jgi:large subunit ribosomal protein L21